MNMYLYKTKSSDDTVTKILTDERLVTIIIKGECNVLDPYVELTFGNDIFDYNFVYLEDFNRYYFVVDIMSIRNGVWGLQLHIDVLHTYGNRIRAHGAFVTRSALFYNPLIVDDRLPFQSDNKFDYNLKFPKSHFSDYSTEYIPESWVITASVNEDNFDEAYENIQSPIGKNLITPSTSTIYTSSINAINAIWESFCAWTNALNPSDLFLNRTDCLIDVKQFPFAITKGLKDDEYVLDTTVKIGNSVIEGIGGRRLLTSKCELNFGELHIPYFDEYGNSTDTPIFTSYPPYTELQIYLPFIGIVDLDAYQVCGKDIQLKYLIDLYGGTCNAIITIKGTDSIVLSVSGEMARIFRLGATNMIEQVRNNIMQITNTALSLTPSYSYRNYSSMNRNVMKKYSRPNIKRMSSKSVVDSSKTSSSMQVNSPSTPSISLPNVSYSHGGVPTSNLSVQMSLDPYIIQKSLILKDDFDLNKYSQYYGRPLEQSVALTDMDGFTVIGDIVLQDIRNGNTKATSDEVNEIYSLLSEGVRF